MRTFALVDTKPTELPNKENLGPITDFINVYGAIVSVTSTGYLVTKLSTFRLSPRSLTCIVAGPKRSEFFCGSYDGDIIVVSSINGRILQKRLHENQVTAIGILGSKGVSGSSDQSILVWELDTLSVVNQLDFHSSQISCIQIIDGSRFISGNSKGGIACWDISKVNPLVWTAVLTRSRSVTYLAVSNSVAVIMDSSNSVVVFDLEDGATLWDHAMGGDKILGGFFPTRNDSSSIFVISESKEGTTVQCVNLTWTGKTITNFTVVGSSVVANEQVLLARKPNVDNTITCLSTSTVRIIKRKS
jgi:hypothetical protein